jgi:uncharacterized protein YecE (DUF72 family)
VEFRHPSWDREETFTSLKRRGAAYCITTGANLPCVLRATTDFVYVRLHGPDQQHLYAGSYSEVDLSRRGIVVTSNRIREDELSR